MAAETNTTSTQPGLRIECRALSCDRGGREVFHGLSFAVGAGEALLVKGPNGVGKSTLLRVLAGLVVKSGGEISLEGGEAERPFAEHLHYFGHLDGLKPALTTLDNLSFWKTFCDPVQGRRGIDPLEALGVLGIEHTASLPAGFLSAGQKRRLALARLLVVWRPIWLLDEPSSALDKASEQTLHDLIEAHLEAGGIVIAATHLPLKLKRVQELLMEPVTADAAQTEAYAGGAVFGDEEGWG